jgi:signal transduction histidine kinase
MLSITITSRGETQVVHHASGILEFGRMPREGGPPRCLLTDAYVSKDHMRLETLGEGRIRLENLSARGPIRHPMGELGPGEQLTLALPTQLLLGETRVAIEFAIPEEPMEEGLKTVLVPNLPMNLSEANKLLSSETPAPEMLMRWFEAVLAVQHASISDPDYYARTARSLVELVGLDSGLVLRRTATGWSVLGRAFRDEGSGGREFSLTILNRVAEQKRTFYRSRFSPGSQSESLTAILSVVASPLFDGTGQVTGAVYGARAKTLRTREIGPLEAQLVQVLASSITAAQIRHQREDDAARLRIEKEAAEAATRAKGQFLAAMSHELRTPLNAIIGYSEMILEAMADDGVTGYEADLAKVTSSGKHLLTLINDILDHSKMVAGKMTLDLERFELQPLLDEVLDTVQPLAKKNANLLERDYAPTLGALHADPKRLKQSLLNLLSNALKFTANGTVTLRARRLADPQRDWVCLQVVDTGIGIPPEKLETIFLEFEQAESSTTRKYGGTGLGLSISRGFCRMMGGDIVVKSQVGEGSTFSIWVPAEVTHTGQPNDRVTLPPYSRDLAAT